MKLVAIFEMAKPNESILNQTFYHGSSNFGEEILKDGFIKTQITSGKKQHMLIPVNGACYATSDLSYAVMYTIGGHLAGTKFDPRDSKFGYLFSFSGKQLSDIQPDEDFIGEMFASYSKNKAPNWLWSLAGKFLAKSTIQKCIDGEYTYFAKAGKVLVKRMTDEQKLELILGGSALANFSNIHFEHAYKFDKEKYLHLLKDDASNFFEFAEKIR